MSQETVSKVTRLQLLIFLMTKLEILREDASLVLKDKELNDNFLVLEHIVAQRMQRETGLDAKCFPDAFFDALNRRSKIEAIKVIREYVREGGTQGPASDGLRECKEWTEKYMYENGYSPNGYDWYDVNKNVVNSSGQPVTQPTPYPHHYQ